MRIRRPRHPVHLLRRVGAGLLAVAALLLALRAPVTAGTPVAGPAGQPVVVSTADLPAGATLGADDVATVEQPPDLVPAGAVADPGALTGRVLAAPVRAGEPLTDVRLVGPGLWSLVGPGQVATPVRLADLAVAALVRPGDRVDVLASRSPDDGTGPVTTEVVAAGALVLTAPPPPGSDPATPGPAGAVPAAADGGGLLVLAVSPDVAADLATSATDATLTVTLGPP